MKITKISKKNKDEFGYGEEIRSMWRNLIKKEQDRVNIGFDLENNDGYDFKTKDLDYSKNDNQYRVKAQICWAGGDWESPICYFRCMFEGRSKFDDGWGQWSPENIKAVIIPKKSNQNLTPSEKDKNRLVAKSGDDGVGSKDLNEKALWDEMVKLANERIKKFYDEYGKDEIDHRFENVGCVRDLAEFM